MVCSTPNSCRRGPCPKTFYLGQVPVDRPNSPISVSKSPSERSRVSDTFSEQQAGSLSREAVNAPLAAPVQPHRRCNYAAFSMRSSLLRIRPITYRLAAVFAGQLQAQDLGPGLLGGLGRLHGDHTNAAALSIHPDEQMNNTTYLAVVKRVWAEWSSWRPTAQYRATLEPSLRRTAGWVEPSWTPSNPHRSGLARCSFSQRASEPEASTAVPSDQLAMIWAKVVACSDRLK